MGYDGPRDLRHCLWYGGFGYHAKWASQDVADVARTLKALALFFRGVVVSDSDLNNHPAFQSITDGPVGPSGPRRVILDALRAGFIRRAPRACLDDETRPWTQREVYAYFERNNPTLAHSRVRLGHPERLDAILDEVEPRQAPVLWSLRDVATVFIARLRAEMNEARYVDEAQREFSRYCLDAAATCRKDLLHEFTAAALLDGARRTATLSKHMLPWAEREIGRSYNGNVAILLGERLPYACPPGLDDVSAPSGPGATAAEHLDAMQVYLDLLSPDAASRTNVVRVIAEGPRGDAVGVSLSLEALDDASFDATEDLREEAAPEALLDARFHAMLAPHRLDASLEAVAALEEHYLARLCRHAHKVAGRLDAIDASRAMGAPEVLRAHLTDPHAATGRAASASFRSGVGVQSYLDPSLVTPRTSTSSGGLLVGGILSLRLRRCDARLVYNRARELTGGGYEIPGLAAQEEVRLLREATVVLTAAYPSHLDAMSMARFAGLDPTRIAARDTVFDQWAEVVHAAVPIHGAPQRRDALREILHIARQERPAVPEVQALCRRYGLG